MIRFIRHILEFSGKEASKIKKAFLPAFLKAILTNIIIFYSLMILMKLLNGSYLPKDSVIIGLFIFMTLALEATFQFATDRLQSATGFEILAEKRRQLGAHLQQLPMGFFTEGNIGKISSVLATDMTFIEENAMTAVANTVSEMFTVAILDIFLFVMDWRIGLAAVIITALAILAGRGIIRTAQQESDARQEQSEELTANIIEFAEGIGIIKAYNLLGDRSKKLTESFRLSAEKNIRFENRYSPWNLLIGIICSAGSVILTILGIRLYTLDELSGEYLIGLAFFVLQVFGPLKALYSECSRFTVMESCLQRIEALFHESKLADNGSEHIPDSAPAGVSELEFKHVSFGYGDKEVLHDVSFSAEQGQFTALVGPSGSGKSTIGNLTLRLWDIEQGQILFRGKDIRTVPVSELMDKVSVVFQRVYLFEDTVMNNIRFGKPDATEDEVIEAAKKARCYDFIMKLPDGFNTVIGEGGATLSGGERQRLSIARCILKDAPLIILDEATASVDVDNEIYIQEAINELCKNKTLLVIAHRLYTIRDANNILVVSNGEIIEQGNHETLIRQNGLYHAFVEKRENSVSWNRHRVAE